MSQPRVALAEDAPRLVLCTCPDRESAEEIANTLVEERLAASVNLVPGICSTYRWRGQVCRAEEHLLLIKTVSGRCALLERAITAVHPYELPQILWVTIECGEAVEGGSHGSSAYLEWIRQSVRAP